MIVTASADVFLVGMEKTASARIVPKSVRMEEPVPATEPVHVPRAIPLAAFANAWPAVIPATIIQIRQRARATERVSANLDLLEKTASVLSLLREPVPMELEHMTVPLAIVSVRKDGRVHCVTARQSVLLIAPVMETATALESVNVTLDGMEHQTAHVSMMI